MLQIQVNIRTNTSAGLGSAASHNLSMDNVSKTKAKANWSRTVERYNAIEQTQQIAKTSKKPGTQQQKWVKGGEQVVQEMSAATDNSKPT